MLCAKLAQRDTHLTVHMRPLRACLTSVETYAFMHAVLISKPDSSSQLHTCATATHSYKGLNAKWPVAHIASWLYMSSER